MKEQTEEERKWMDGAVGRERPSLAVAVMLIDAHKAYWSLQYSSYYFCHSISLLFGEESFNIQYRYYAQFTEIHTTEPNEASFATLQGSHCHPRQQHRHGCR